MFTKGGSKAFFLQNSKFINVFINFSCVERLFLQLESGQKWMETLVITSQLSTLTMRTRPLTKLCG